LHLLCCCCLAQAFCWLCGGATGTRHTWTQIDNHSCGRYKDEADAKVGECLRTSAAAAVAVMLLMLLLQQLC
jgi:hypothetical protein